MENFNVKLVICGLALLLLGINICLAGHASLSVVVGLLGAFLVGVGCFAKDDSEKR